MLWTMVLFSPGDTTNNHVFTRFRSPSSYFTSPAKDENKKAWSPPPPPLSRAVPSLPPSQNPIDRNPSLISRSLLTTSTLSHLLASLSSSSPSSPSLFSPPSLISPTEISSSSPPAILPVGARVSGARGRRGKGDERDDDGRPVEDEARPALLLRGRGLGGGGGDKGGEERREGFGGLRRGSAGRGGIGDASHFRAGFLAGSEERRGSLFVCGGRGRGREVLEKRSGLKWNEVKRTKGTAPQGSRETSREILNNQGLVWALEPSRARDERKARGCSAGYKGFFQEELN